MTGIPISEVGHIKCAASSTRLCPPWDEFDVDYRVAYEGDVIAVEALGEAGAYVEVENSAGRSERLYEGDTFLAVLGNRQSSKYLNGFVPPEGVNLDSTTVLQLLSNGGLVGLCREAPHYLGPPLDLRCRGVLVRNQRSVNTITGGRREVTASVDVAPLVLVGGSSTDIGKTTLTARLVASLTRQEGLRVAAAKLAGTGCLEDVLQYQDAGAAWIADFPDFGLPSTYTAVANYVPAIESLLRHLSEKSPDLIVAELGGDVIWANIPTLLTMPVVREALQALLIIPSDVLTAIGARVVLAEWGVPASVVHWCIPPMCNSRSFRERMDAYALAPLMDTRSGADVARLARLLRDRIR